MARASSVWAASNLHRDFEKLLHVRTSEERMKDECTFHPIPGDPIAGKIHLVDNRIELSNMPRMFILV
jgi:hypothetical protein